VTLTRRALLGWKPFSNTAVLAIALVQNLLILLRFGDDGAREPDAASGLSAERQQYHRTLGAAQMLLGCVQVP
jgi:hypothetical protein